MGMGQSWLIMDGVFMANGLGIYDLNGCGSYGKAGCCFVWKYAQKKPCRPPPIPSAGSPSEVNCSGADAQVASCRRYLVFHPFDG